MELKNAFFSVLNLLGLFRMLRVLSAIFYRRQIEITERPAVVEDLSSTPETLKMPQVATFQSRDKPYIPQHWDHRNRGVDPTLLTTNINNNTLTRSEQPALSSNNAAHDKEQFSISHMHTIVGDIRKRIMEFRGNVLEDFFVFKSEFDNIKQDVVTRFRNEEQTSSNINAITILCCQVEEELDLCLNILSFHDILRTFHDDMGKCQPERYLLDLQEDALKIQNKLENLRERLHNFKIWSDTYSYLSVLQKAVDERLLSISLNKLLQSNKNVKDCMNNYSDSIEEFEKFQAQIDWLERELTELKKRPQEQIDNERWEYEFWIVQDETDKNKQLFTELLEKLNYLNAVNNEIQLRYVNAVGNFKGTNAERAELQREILMTWSNVKSVESSSCAYINDVATELSQRLGYLSDELKQKQHPLQGYIDECWDLYRNYKSKCKKCEAVIEDKTSFMADISSVLQHVKSVTEDCRDDEIKVQLQNVTTAFENLSKYVAATPERQTVYQVPLNQDGQEKKRYRQMAPNEKIEFVLKRHADLDEDVQHFNGSKDDPKFVELDERLSRLIDTIDLINIDDNQQLRQKKKAAIVQIQQSINALKLKAEQHIVTKTSVVADIHSTSGEDFEAANDNGEFSQNTDIPQCEETNIDKLKQDENNSSVPTNETQSENERTNENNQVMSETSNSYITPPNEAEENANINEISAPENPHKPETNVKGLETSV